MTLPGKRARTNHRFPREHWQPSRTPTLDKTGNIQDKRDLSVACAKPQLTTMASAIGFPKRSQIWHIPLQHKCCHFAETAAKSNQMLIRTNSTWADSVMYSLRNGIGSVAMV